MTLTDLNASDRDGFVKALGWIFEGSPWVAERAWARRPFASTEALHTAMHAEMAAADRHEQLALLRAHPDLGERARMSDASTTEQANAGLNRVSAADLARLQQLNAAYREKFGFPFLFAVRGSTTHDVLDALDRRLSASVEEELAEALRQVSRIAAFRLNDCIRG